MSVKTAEIVGIGPVKFYKRRGNRALKITIGHENEVKVSIPSWLPYKAGHHFLLSRLDWVNKQLDSRQVLLSDGMRIGKAHQLKLSPTEIAKTKGRLIGNEVIVYYPSHFTHHSRSVQDAAKKAATEALKKEAQTLLPVRIADLASSNGLKYKRIGCRRLKSRWGSCSSNGDINLNIFLMQLPWHLIDYVLLHELTHTKVMSHGPKFWQTLESFLPEARSLRQEIKSYRPSFVYLQK